METRFLHSISPKPPLPILPRLSAFPRQTLFRIRASVAADENQHPRDLSALPPTRPPEEPLEIRFRRGSRKRRQLREEDLIRSATKQELSARTRQVPKKWEEMTVGEKSVELYMGEKGLLFWLNKFAYASIFVVIGGWLLFRFVGPSLNLYQLDTAPLAPQSLFKGPQMQLMSLVFITVHICPNMQHTLINCFRIQKEKGKKRNGNEGKKPSETNIDPH